MRRLMMAGFVGILVVSGCASRKPASTGATPEAASPAVAAPPETARAAAVATAPDSGQSQAPPPAAALPGQSEASSVASRRSAESSQAPDVVAAVAPPVSAVPGSNPTPAKSSTGARPAKQAGAAAPLGAANGPATASNRPPTSGKSPTPPHSASSEPPVSSAPQPPASSPTPAPQATLNLADLEQRLRETRAIGVFTKLSLKNQVDDLLKSFRDLYRDPNKRPSAELRQRYDLLLLKVLSLLQDSDPPLATAIASSREAIWSILADPDKFAKI